MEPQLPTALTHWISQTLVTGSLVHSCLIFLFLYPCLLASTPNELLALTSLSRALLLGQLSLSQEVPVEVIVSIFP